LQKNITTGIVFTAMDNGANLSKVGGHRSICSQSHEIMFHVHSLGKQKQAGKQNKVVARTVTEACGLSLRTVHFIFQVSGCKTTRQLFRILVKYDHDRRRSLILTTFDNTIV
jgi:hypothetical protein